MALSNWAILAWNENGEPCDGRLEAEGVSISIYKNWIYVRDEKAWKEGSMFNKPTIMEISEGQIEYHRFKIIAKRGKNNEVFVLAEYSGNQKETKQLIGIGAYAYDDDGNYVGVTEETKGEFFNWIRISKEDWWFPMLIDVTKIKEFKTFNQGDKYIADKFGLETPVNTDEPILSKALKNIEKDK
jgi:hypothetical protein